MNKKLYLMLIVVLISVIALSGCSNSNYAIESDFHNGYAIISNKNDLYGYINTDGQVTVPTTYEKVSLFEDGVAKVYSEETGDIYIDPNNNILLTCKDYANIYDQMENYSGSLIGVVKNVSDINSNEDSQYLGSKKFITKEPKIKSGIREISLGGDVCKLLKAYKAWQNEQRIRLGDRWVDHDRLFTMWNGNPIYPDTITQWFPQFLQRHGFRKVRLHSLRHTNATLMIADGVDICTVSKRLGHANTSTTLNIYAHSLESRDEDAARKMDDMLSTKSKKLGGEN